MAWILLAGGRSSTRSRSGSRPIPAGAHQAALHAYPRGLLSGAVERENRRLLTGTGSGTKPNSPQKATGCSAGDNPSPHIIHGHFHNSHIRQAPEVNPLSF